MTNATISQRLSPHTFQLTANTTNFLIHPDYTQPIFGDIGVIKFKTPMTNVTTIDLPTVCDAQTTITGSRICSCGDVQEIISRCACNAAYNDTVEIKDSIICVKRTEVSENEACSDRLGKGLVINLGGRCVVIGVLSKNGVGMPKIYTKVTSFLAFIRLKGLL
jgi:hypothetical protein